MSTAAGHNLRTAASMVHMLVLSVLDRGFEPRSGQPKTMKLVFVASLLSTQLKEERAKTG